MSYSEKFIVPYMMCDRYENLSMRSLISMMAEVSIDHSYLLQKDLDMEKYRWIVYSWDINLIETIKAGDQVEVETRVVKMNKFYAYRNVLIKKDGLLVSKAYGVFLLVDINRMRPVKMPAGLLEAYIKDDLVYKKPKLTYKKDFANSKEIMIRYTDIDSNFHVNNAVYFDYIIDLCQIDTKDINFFNIVYKHEIRNKKSIIGEYTEEDGQIDYRLRSVDGKTIYTYGKIIRNV